MAQKPGAYTKAKQEMKERNLRIRKAESKIKRKLSAYERLYLEGADFHDMCVESHANLLNIYRVATSQVAMYPPKMNNDESLSLKMKQLDYLNKLQTQIGKFERTIEKLKERPEEDLAALVEDRDKVIELATAQKMLEQYENRSEDSMAVLRRETKKAK